MHKQSLYLVGGALLASTALTTIGHAATIRSSNGGVGFAPATLTPFPVATQVFSATTTTANGITLGGGTSTSANVLLVDLAPTFASFDLKLDISSSTAAFSTTTQPTVLFYSQTTGGTLEAIPNASVGGCTVQPAADRISILACNPTTINLFPTRIDAIGIVGINYTSASALRTPSTSITLSGSTFAAGTPSTFEAVTAAAVITSKSAATDLTVDGGTNATIDNNATPVFAQLVSSGVTTSVVATLGSVHFSTAGAVSTDLSNTFASYPSLATTTEVKITHSVLTDAALTKISFSNTNKTSTDFVSGTVSFTVTSASLSTTAITATFNATTAISETTGSPSATVTPTAGGAGVAAALPAATGSLARLSRGGLSVELNTILPSAMKASYISFLRIANQSSVASTAIVTVRNDSTNALVGSFATASIAAGGVAQVNSVDIDTALTAAGATPLTNASYKVTVSGSFNGYVQSLLYNVTSQVFADASGFRNGTLTTDP